MLFQCRVFKEIWEYSPVQHLSGNQLNVNELNINVEELMNLNKDPTNICPLYSFIGWGIWKMRNNLVFNGKRELIPDTINKAVIYCQQWIEAIHQSNDQQEQSNSQEKEIIGQKQWRK